MFETCEVPTPRDATKLNPQQSPTINQLLSNATHRARSSQQQDGTVQPMPIFDEEMDNMCEGCMTRNTGDNFAHAAFARAA